MKDSFGNTKRTYGQMAIFFGAMLVAAAIIIGVQIDSIVRGFLHVAWIFILSFLFIHYWRAHDEFDYDNQN